MKQKPSQIGEQYNIALRIIKAAEARGLDAIATGGGFDYITRLIGDESNAPRMILGCADDAGSPDTLCEKANVTLYLNDEQWDEDYISFNFETCVEAMDFMAGFETVVLNMAGVTDDSCRACGHKLGTSENCLMCEAYLEELEGRSIKAITQQQQAPQQQQPMVGLAKRVLGFRDTDQPNGITPEPAQGWDKIEGGEEQ